MAIVKLVIPPSAVDVIGDLYDTQNIYDLTQDLICVEMPDHVYIDAGWYPDWDPDGEYRVIVFKDDVDNLLRPPIHTKDVEEVVQAMQDAMSRYNVL